MAAGLGAIRVLVVDDNKQMRTIVGTVLSAIGVGSLHYAPDGREALQILKHVPVDIAYIDHEMPHLNGVELARTIRSLPAPDCFLPLIMLTGHSDVRRLNAARDAGVTEFLAKPVTTTAILRRLDSVIMRPRPFVSSPDYYGPDRRRRDEAGNHGPKRRLADTRGSLQI